MSYEIEYDDQIQSGRASDQIEIMRQRAEIEYQTRLAISVPRDQKQIDADEWIERYGCPEKDFQTA